MLEQFLTVVSDVVATSEENQNADFSSAEIPVINILPTCWADFDLSTLLSRELLTDPYLKVHSIKPTVGIFNDTGEEELVWNGKYFIHELEEDIPSQEMRDNFLTALIIKQSVRMKEFNSKLPTADAIHKRLEIINIFMETIYDKYHNTNLNQNVDKKLKHSTLSEQLEGVSEERNENVLLELGVKAAMTTIFMLLRRSLSSNDQEMNSICNDILQPCADMMLSVPNLCLSNESRLSKSALLGINNVREFLIELVQPSNKTTAESKRYACEILLGLSLLQGSVTYLLDWIELCLHNSLLSNIPNHIAGYQFNHWMKSFTKDKVYNEEYITISNAAMKFMEVISAEALGYTQTLTGTSLSTPTESISLAVYGWGSNSNKQLVEPNRQKVVLPIKNASFQKAVQIEAGQHCTFAVFPDGSLYSCGKGAYGRLGLGDSFNQPYLKKLNMCGCHIIQVSSSKGSDPHSLALSKDGKVFSWGDGDYGKLGHGNKLVQKIPKIISSLKNKVVRCISAGGKHSAAITRENELYTWGEGEHGRLGHGDNGSQKIPVRVRKISAVGQVSAGSAHTVALSVDGNTVWTFGAGENGKLGHGDDIRQFHPKVVENLLGLRIRKVLAGSQCTMALTSTGLIYVWGCGPCLGAGAADMVYLSPKIIDALKGRHIIDVALGEGHCLALTKEHVVYSWGHNSNGQCGVGNCITPVLYPTVVKSLEDVKVEQICAGSSHSFAWNSPPIDRKLVALSKPYCIYVKEETFSRLCNFLELYSDRQDELNTLSDDPTRSFADDFVCHTLDLLSSHLLLAICDETLSSTVLGEKGDIIMQLMLRMIDAPDLSKVVFSKIKSTLQIGAQFLLPMPQERIKLLVDLLPETGDQLTQTTIGKALFLRIILDSIANHSIIADMFGFGLHARNEGRNTTTPLKETHYAVLQKVMLLLLRIAALLTEQRSDKDVTSNNAEIGPLCDSVLKLLAMLQNHLISHLMKVKENSKEFIYCSETLEEYISVYIQHSCRNINKASSLIGNKKTVNNEERNCILDYLMHSLAGSTLFSLIHSLMLLPPACLHGLIEPLLLNLFFVLNKINTLSPARGMIETQEMQWPFINKDTMFDNINACTFPFSTISKPWIWLSDLQHVLALLIGRLFHSTILPTHNISKGEKICKKWLSSLLVKNGLEERDKLCEHALIECTNQLQLCTLNVFECKLQTELPNDMYLLMDLANSPTDKQMIELCNDLYDYGVARELLNEDLNSDDCSNMLMKACVRYTFASIIHHCQLFEDLIAKKCSGQILHLIHESSMLVYEMLLQKREEIKTNFDESDISYKPLLQYCKALLNTCTIMLLCVKPCRDRNKTISVDMIQNICSEIVRFLKEENVFYGEYIVASHVKKAFSIQLERAEVRVHSLKSLSDLFKQSHILNEDVIIPSCFFYLLSSSFGKRRECLVSKYSSLLCDIESVPCYLKRQIIEHRDKIIIMLRPKHEYRETKTMKDYLYIHQKILADVIATSVFDAESVELFISHGILNVVDTKENGGEVAKLYQPYEDMFIHCMTMLVAEHADSLPETIVNTIALNSMKTIDNLMSGTASTVSKDEKAYAVAFVKRCCLINKKFAEKFLDAQIITKLIKMIDSNGNSLTLRIATMKLLKIILLAADENTMQKLFNIIESLIHLMVKFVWVEPFTRNEAPANNECNDIYKPITFNDEKMKNVTIQNDFTVCHSGESKGYCLVDTDLQEANLYCEWNVEITRDMNIIETILIGVCQFPFQRSDFKTSSGMWLCSGYMGELFNDGRKLLRLLKFGKGDVITCRYNRGDCSLSFAKNGGVFQEAFTDLPGDALYPCVMFSGDFSGQEVTFKDLKFTKERSNKKRYDPVSASKSITLCEAARSLIVDLVPHFQGFFSSLFNNVCENIEQQIELKSNTIPNNHVAYTVFSLLVLINSIDRSFACGKMCTDADGRTAMIVSECADKNMLCIQWSDGLNISNLDYSKLKPVISKPLTYEVLNTLPMSRLLSLCLEIPTIVKSTKIAPLVTNEMLFGAQDAKGVYSIILKSSLEILLMKCVHYIVKSPQFTTLLCRYYSVKITLNGTKTKSTNSIDDEEQNHFLSLLKTLLKLSCYQSSALGCLDDIVDYERALNVLLNQITVEEFNTECLNNDELKDARLNVPQDGRLRVQPEQESNEQPSNVVADFSSDDELTTSANFVGASQMRGLPTLLRTHESGGLRRRRVIDSRNRRRLFQRHFSSGEPRPFGNPLVDNSRQYYFEMFGNNILSQNTANDISDISTNQMLPGPAMSDLHEEEFQEATVTFDEPSLAHLMLDDILHSHQSSRFMNEINYYDLEEPGDELFSSTGNSWCCPYCEETLTKFTLVRHFEAAHPGCRVISNHIWVYPDTFLFGKDTKEENNARQRQCGSCSAFLKFYLCNDCHNRYSANQSHANARYDHLFTQEEVNRAPDLLGEFKPSRCTDFHQFNLLFPIQTSNQTQKFTEQVTTLPTKNLLGVINNESYSVFDTHRHHRNAHSLRHNQKNPIIFQAAMLYNYRMLNHGAKRLVKLTNDVIHQDILFTVLKLLVHSLTPLQLLYALKDLDITNVDLLLDMLCGLTVHLKQGVINELIEENIDVMFTVIRALLVDNNNSMLLPNMMETIKNFFMFLKNDGTVNNPNCSTRPRQADRSIHGDFDIQQMIKKAQAFIEVLCCKDVFAHMLQVASKTKALHELLEVLSLCILAKDLKIYEWAMVMFEKAIYLITSESQEQVFIQQDESLPSNMSVELNKLENQVKEFAWNDSLKSIASDDNGNFVITDFRDLLHIESHFYPCEGGHGFQFNETGTLYSCINNGVLQIAEVFTDVWLKNCDVNYVTCYCWPVKASVGFHGDCQLISSSSKGDVSLITVNKNCLDVEKLDYLSNPKASVTSIAWYQEADIVTIGYSNGDINTASILNKTVHWNTNIFLTSIKAIDFSPCGRYVAVLAANCSHTQILGSHGEDICNVSLDSHECQIPTITSWRPVQSTPNILQLAIGYSQGTVAISTLSIDNASDDQTLSPSDVTVQTLNVLNEHASNITCLRYNKVGDMLTSACQRGLIYLHYVDEIKAQSSRQISESLCEIRNVFWIDNTIVGYVSHNTNAIEIVNVLKSSRSCDTLAVNHSHTVQKVLQGADHDGVYLLMFLKKLLKKMNKMYVEEKFLLINTCTVHSSFTQSSFSVASMLRYDTIIPASSSLMDNLDDHNVLHRFRLTLECSDAFKARTPLPTAFLASVELEEMCEISKDNSQWSLKQDKDIIHWFNNIPKDWEPDIPQSVCLWGSGSHGQLAELTPGRLEPDFISSFKQVSEIVCGQNCSFVIQANGNVQACGAGSYGRLGQGSSDDESALIPISELQGYTIIQLDTSLGGDGHCIAVSDTGEAFSWGDGDYGKLGHGNSDRQRKPKHIKALQNYHIVQVACGYKHSAALTMDGKLFMFGQGENGLLGNGGNVPEKIPQRVVALRNEDIGQVACGKSHTLALSSDGLRLYSWGDGEYGKLGHGSTNIKTTPKLVDSLTNVGLKKVACGAKHSIALGSNGTLYSWGHSNFVGATAAIDTTIPQIVQPLRSCDVIDVSVGCDYVVALDSMSQIWSWGCNLDGQLGNGTNISNYIPSMVKDNPDVRLTRISAGTSHCAAWSGDIKKPRLSKLIVGLPRRIPPCYASLQRVDRAILKDRLHVLWHFSELVGQFWTLMSLNRSDCMLMHTNIFQDGILRPLLTTRTHSLHLARALRTIPSLHSNTPKVRVKRFDMKGKKCDPVFKQMAEQILAIDSEDSQSLGQAWKVKLVNEAADDAGGVFDEVLTHICMELEERKEVNLLLPTPNSLSEVGFNRDRFIINVSLYDHSSLRNYRFIGILMGMAIRTKKPLDLHLAPMVWSQLAGITLTVKDIEEIDALFTQHIEMIKNYSSECTDENIDDPLPLLTYVCQSSSGRVIPLIPGGENIELRRRDCQTYIDKAIKFRLNEFKTQLQSIREGLESLIPKSLLSLLTGQRLEQMVCGSQEIKVETLKKISRHREVEGIGNRLKWFWEVLHSFSKDEMVAFLRFVSGRSRLPANVNDIPHKFQIVGAEKPVDGLPTAQTCFFVLRLPPYTSKQILADKLRYAIQNCRAIDTDYYMLETSSRYT